MDARTLQSTPESGGRAGYDGAKKKKGSKANTAVDTLGNLLAVYITAASEQDRDQVAILSQKVQVVTGSNVEIAYVDQGYTGESAAEQANASFIRLQVINHAKAKRAFVLLPRRWVAERTFGCLSRFRRLAHDYERHTITLTNFHWLAFLTILLATLYRQSQ